MKPAAWKTYRTRFLVKAKQLSSSLSFVDSLGRQHCGRKGDYLVESCDGVISIAPRQIFEDIYVPMSLIDAPHFDDGKNNNGNFVEEKITDRPLNHVPIESLDIEEVKLTRSPIVHRPITGADAVHHDATAHERGKFPQPYRDRRSPPSRLRLM